MCGDQGTHDSSGTRIILLGSGQTNQPTGGKVLVFQHKANDSMEATSGNKNNCRDKKGVATNFTQK